MQAYPHHYSVHARAGDTGSVELRAPDLPVIHSSPPAQFDGPGDQWSPESLLVAAVADCFVLTFRAVARASHCEWIDLECDAVGTLDRVERVSRFVSMTVSAKLTVAPGTDPDAAKRLLEKAENTCLITNSLAFPVTLQASVIVR